MQIIISDKSNVPIYEQITKQIKEGILSRALEADEMLPSIRQLAKELQISVITTKRAYEELENEGMIYSVPQKGFFVSPSKVEILKEKRLKLIEDAASKLISESRAAGLSLDEIQSMLELLWEE
ncbi:transcriptional regulator protein [Firmicutes bacterium CAG:882]|nr:transcriptional regulator protein [Firmicutes bacterium CAG:882]